MDENKTELTCQEMEKEAARALLESIQRVSERIAKGTASDKEYDFLPDAAFALRRMIEA